MKSKYQKGLDSLDIRNKPRTPDEPKAKDWHKNNKKKVKS